MRMYVAVFCFALAACFVFVSCKKENAESGALKMNLKKYCAADLEKFCKSVEPGGGRLVKCLDQHKSELSQACIEHVTSVREYRKNQKKKSQS